MYNIDLVSIIYIILLYGMLYNKYPKNMQNFRKGNEKLHNIKK